MIHGAHVLLYSKDPEADRAFFSEVLNFRSVDVGGGWLIFALPPAELAVHPGDFLQEHAGHSLLGAVLYLMCDNLQETIKSLKAQKVNCTEIETERWGIRTTIKLPSGSEIGLYQPTHASPLDFKMSFSASSADERVMDVQFTDDTLSVSLRDGRVITVPLVWYPRLLSATPSQRKNWQVAGGGYGIHWPDVDEDLSADGLLRGAPAAKSSIPVK